ERFRQQFKATSDAIIDSWFVCYADKHIFEYNRVFFSMFPRQEARTLKGRKFSDVLRLSIDDSACIVEQCWREKRHVRLDEISGAPLGYPEDQPKRRYVLSAMPILDEISGAPLGYPEDQPRRRYVLSAMPILDEAGEPVGALEIQRDVTDEALV